MSIFKVPLLAGCYVCGLLIAVAPTAHADLIEFTFAGEIELIEGLVPVPWDGVEVGSPWEVRYFFDSEAEDSDDSSLFGFYPMISAEVTVAGETLFTDEGFIFVNYLNQELSYRFDDLEIGEAGASGVVRVVGSSDSLPDDSLPQTLDLDDFFASYLQIAPNGGGWVIQGDTLSFSSQVIPTPLTVAPFIISFCLYRERRRR